MKTKFGDAEAIAEVRKAAAKAAYDAMPKMRFRIRLEYSYTTEDTDEFEVEAVDEEDAFERAREKLYACSDDNTEVTRETVVSVEPVATTPAVSEQQQQRLPFPGDDHGTVR